MPDLHTDINIHETINSGQIFLWENYGNEWFVIDGHDVIMAKQKPFEIITFSKKPKNFFREDDNYRKILKNITKDKIAAEEWLVSITLQPAVSMGAQHNRKLRTPTAAPVIRHWSSVVHC